MEKRLVLKYSFTFEIEFRNLANCGEKKLYDGG